MSSHNFEQLRLTILVHFSRLDFNKLKNEWAMLRYLFVANLKLDFNNYKNESWFVTPWSVLVLMSEFVFQAGRSPSAILIDL